MAQEIKFRSGCSDFCIEINQEVPRTDLTIKELSEIIQRTVRHTGEIIWDSTKQTKCHANEWMSPTAQQTQSRYTKNLQGRRTSFYAKIVNTPERHQNAGYHACDLKEKLSSKDLQKQEDIFHSVKMNKLNNPTVEGRKVSIYDPWAEPKEVMHEYGLTITNTLPIKKFDAVVLGVSHTEFNLIDLQAITKTESIIYDVKGVLSPELVDGKL
jgi:hypothetical protein